MNINWVLFGSSTVCGILCIVFLSLSLSLGKPTKYDSSKGTIRVLYAFEQDEILVGNSTEYCNTLISIINNAKNSLEFTSRIFNFYSNLDPVYEAIKMANDRNVKIRIITTNRTRSTTFNDLSNVQIRLFPWSPNKMSILSTDMVINDNDCFMIGASIYDYSRFNKTNVIAFLFEKTPDVREDALRCFNLAWLSLDDKDKRSLPPFSTYWNYNIQALSNSTNPMDVGSQAKVFIAQSPGEFRAPLRDLTVDATKNIIKSAKSHIFIYATIFHLENGDFVVHNSLISAANRHINVSILLSHRNNYNASVQQASMLAGIPNIDVRVCSKDLGVPDLLIVDDTTAFVSGPVTGPLFGNSLGVEVFVKSSFITNDIKSKLSKQWENSSSFDDPDVLKMAYLEKRYS